MLGTKTKATAALKIMVFKVEELFIGLNLEGVEKVIAMPTVHKGGNSFLGVAQVEDRQIVVIDLYRTIYGTSVQQGKGYFIIVKAGVNAMASRRKPCPQWLKFP